MVDPQPQQTRGEAASASRIGDPAGAAYAPRQANGIERPAVGATAPQQH